MVWGQASKWRHPAFGQGEVGIAPGLLSPTSAGATLAAKAPAACRQDGQDCFEAAGASGRLVGGKMSFGLDVGSTERIKSSRVIRPG